MADRWLIAHMTLNEMKLDRRSTMTRHQCVNRFFEDHNHLLFIPTEYSNILWSWFGYMQEKFAESEKSIP